MEKILFLITIVSGIYNLEAMNAVPQNSGESVMAQVLRSIQELKAENEGLKARIKTLEMESFAAPDYTKCEVLIPMSRLKSVEGTVQKEPFQIKTNGWLFIGGYSWRLTWVGLKINGKDVTPDSGFFSYAGAWLDTGSGNGSMILPVYAGDEVQVTGGSHHRLMFYPCKHFE